MKHQTAIQEEIDKLGRTYEEEVLPGRNSCSVFTRP